MWQSPNPTLWKHSGTTLLLRIRLLVLKVHGRLKLSCLSQIPISWTVLHIIRCETIDRSKLECLRYLFLPWISMESLLELLSVISNSVNALIWLSWFLYNHNRFLFSLLICLLNCLNFFDSHKVKLNLVYFCYSWSIIHFISQVFINVYL